MAGRTRVWVSPQEHKVVGEVLAEFRKAAGLRQQDIAARLNKTQSFVSDYEGGQRRIDVLELLRIAEVIGVDPQEIFGEIVRRRGRAVT